jgi:hypothetical protein
MEQLDESQNQELTLLDQSALEKTKKQAAKAHTTIIDETPQDEVKFQHTASSLYELARLVRICKSVAKTQEQLSLWLDEANAVGEPQTYIDDALRRYELCLNAPSVNPLSALIKSIEMGSEQAVIELWTWSEQEFIGAQQLGSLTRAQLLEQRSAFKALKYDSAHNVAMAGGEEALLRLIKAYQSGSRDSAYPDLVKAYAYTQFALEISTNNDLYGKVRWFQRSLESKLSYQQIDRATELSRHWLETIN